MMNQKTILALIIGFALLSIALYVSLSTAFIVLLLGFLVVPPVLVVVSTFIEGVRTASLNRLPISKKEAIIISISS